MNHEIKTENFFQHGIEKYGNFHGNYLNFGLWENGINDYVKAAENMLIRVGKKINLNKDSLLLDVACGMGAQDLFFMENFKCKKIEALDLTKKHIELAKTKNKYKNINYVIGNACKLSYGNNSFTHLTGIEGPVNFNTREKFFKEAHRVLKKNGMLGMSDFILARKPKNMLEDLLVKFCSWLWCIPSENADTEESYKFKLERSGFTNVDIEVVSKYAYPGYYKEQIKPQTRKSMYKIRGNLIARASLSIDFVTYMLYKFGLIGYILISAKKSS